MDVPDRTYFRDETDSDISGIVVIESSDDYVRVTENRLGWCVPFQMPISEFRESVVDKTTHVGQLAESQYDKVVDTASIEA